MNIDKSNDKMQIEDYLEIKNIGTEELQWLNPPLPGDNWSFTPSGRFCAHFRRKRRIIKSFNDYYLFTFIDLVDKVCFEIKIGYERDDGDEVGSTIVDSFYFTSDDEIIVISAVPEEVKQFVYKIDYIGQKLKLQETIAHQFIERKCYITWSLISCQTDTYLSYNKTDYVVVVAYGSGSKIANIVGFYMIYMIPRNPSDKDKPTKEYQIHITEEERLKMEQKINQHFKFDNRLEVTIDVDSYLFDGTNIMLSCKTTLGTLVGGYLVVNLTELKDIANIQLNTSNDIHQLIQEQAHRYTFLISGDSRITEIVHLQCYDKDVGRIYIVENKLRHPNEDSTSVLVYPINMTDCSQSVRLNCKIETEACEHRYALHPGGALLQFEYAKGSSIRLRLLKCLKVNLLCLAFNRALFHKHINLNGHPVFRLCCRKF